MPAAKPTCTSSSWASTSSTALTPRSGCLTYPDINGEPEESRHRALSPYLFDASCLVDSHRTLRQERNAINAIPKLVIGSKPFDGGHYIFDASEREAFLEAEPYLRLFIGACEYLHGGQRWILALHDAESDILARLLRVRERIATVRAYRQDSESLRTQKLADTSTIYHVNVLPASPFLVIPEVGSDRRDYAPIGWLEPPTIPSNLVRVLPNATLTDFS